MSATTRAIECWREPDGTLRCNIPHRHRHHCPTGFECGYSGSCSADLALPITPGSRRATASTMTQAATSPPAST